MANEKVEPQPSEESQQSEDNNRMMDLVLVLNRNQLLGQPSDAQISQEIWNQYGNRVDVRMYRHIITIEFPTKTAVNSASTNGLYVIGHHYDLKTMNFYLLSL